MRQAAGATGRRGDPKRRPMAELPRPMAFEVCDGCGRTLLTGEKSVRLARDEQTLTACPLCVAKLRAGGFLRAA